MGAFTPGPWSVVAFDRRRSGAICDLGYGIQVAHTPVLDDIPSEEESAANARLIAAAPELYEALRWLVNTSHDIGKDGEPCTMNEHIAAIESGMAVLAKAEGK